MENEVTSVPAGSARAVTTNPNAACPTSSSIESVSNSERPAASGHVTRKYSSSKLPMSDSMDVCSPDTTEKLATMNIVHRATIQLVARALVVYLNNGRDRIGFVVR